jgi:putative transposase
MSHHSYARIWLHLMWATLRRELLLHPQAASALSEHLYKQAADNGIFMKRNHVEGDHVHAVVDLPTGKTLEDVIRILKGESSHWINMSELLSGTFHWGRGYAAFSVSQSSLDRLCAFLDEQERYHLDVSAVDEFREFARLHGLQWRGGLE